MQHGNLGDQNPNPGCEVSPFQEGRFVLIKHQQVSLRPYGNRQWRTPLREGREYPTSEEPNERPNIKHRLATFRVSGLNWRISSLSRG